jgi:hypothetical protein
MLAAILPLVGRMLATLAQVLILVFQSDASVPSSPSDADAPAHADADGEWSRRYEQARAEMLAGRFADAAAHFAALAADAPGPGRRTLAREQHDICDRWARGGLVLVRSADLAAARESPRPTLLDRRSADEIGILYTDAVLYGLGTGVALDTWTEPSSASGGILPVLALGGVAAGLVYFIDHPEPLRYGVAQSITSGMWVGFEEGLAWTLWNQARSGRSEEWSAHTVATALWGTATAGAALGGVLGNAYGTTPGRASFMGSAALWTGLVSGLIGATALEKSSTADEGFMLASAIGLNAGVVAGVLIGKDVSPSIARVRFLDLGGLAGGIVAGGIYLAIADKDADQRTATGVLAAGITGGLLLAWHLTAGMEPDYPRAGHPATLGMLDGLTPTLSPSASNGRAVDGAVVGVGGAF